MNTRVPGNLHSHKVVVDYVGNVLIDAIWRNHGYLLEMGLKVPSRGDCWTVFEMSDRITSESGSYLDCYLKVSDCLF